MRSPNLRDYDESAAFRAIICERSRPNHSLRSPIRCRARSAVKVSTMKMRRRHDEIEASLCDDSAAKGRVIHDEVAAPTYNRNLYMSLSYRRRRFGHDRRCLDQPPSFSRKKGGSGEA